MDDFFSNPKRNASFEPDPNGNHWVERIVDWLEDDIDEDPLSPELVHQFMQHPHWSLSVGEQVLDFLRRNAPADSSRDVSEDDQTVRTKLRSLLPRLSEWYLRLLIENGSEGDEAIDLVVAEQAGILYQSIYTRQLASCEGPLLQALSWNRRQAAVSLLANLLVTYPPHDWSATALGISPLMRSNLWNPDWLFPRLLDAMAHATAIAPVLDLANFATRNRLTTVHPAKGHSESLIGLLGEVVSRMGVLEENPKRFGKTVEEVQHVLGESVALCVSLCDAVAWIGNPAAVPKLNQAMELRHRRIQTEASAALARFGDDAGKARLIQLASDPAARLRVLQYAKEIGIEEEIDEQYKTNVAKAESDLALWLSQTPQMSLPPSELELLSQRTMFWPGYHEPQECFLFRYSYRFPDCEFSNVGMAGPIVHSLQPI